MKKRLSLIIIAAVVLLSGTMIYAVSDILKEHKKIDGRYQVFDNMLQEIPTKSEFEEETGNVKAGNSSTYDKEKDKKEKSITTDIKTKKKDKSFKVEYFEKDGQKKPINNTLYGYNLLKLNEDLYLIDDNFNIYQLNMRTMEIDMLVNGSDSNITLDSEEYKKLSWPIWATNPIISPDKKFMLFYTTRDASILEGETILKNLTTGNEQKIADGQCFFVGNSEANEVYVKNREILCKINFEQCAISKETDEYMLAPIIKYPYLAYFNNDEALIVKNLNTGENHTISPFDPKLGNPIGTDLNKDDSIENILFLYQPNSESLATTICVLDPKKMTYKEIVLNAKTMLQTYGWIDKNTLSLSVIQIGPASEETYIVDLNKIEEQKY